MLKPMTDIKQHEYDLLSEISQNSMGTQSHLSSRLGIAVGSVNWYIKRLISRGWLKVSHLDRTRLKYDLTSEGMAVLSQRALLYARDSLKVYGEYRKRAKALVKGLKEQGVQSVYIEGDDEVMDIMRLTCIENEILLSDTFKGVALKSVGQEFQVIVSSS
jgi:DNA-binding MarR family transcriptional regulator